MDLSVVVTICFAALASLGGATFLVLRDLQGVPSEANLRSRLISRRGGSIIRRPRTVFDQNPAIGFSDRLDQKFDQLILESGLDCEPLTAFLLIGTSGLLVGGGILVYWDNVLAAVAGALCGMVATLVYLLVRRVRRMNGIREQIPQVFDLLARSVRAGTSLDQALTLVGSETAGPLGTEFTWCARQMEMGMSLPAVMRIFCNRLRLIEIRILASTLLVHRQTGGNLPRALDRMAAVVRDRLNFRRQMRAATAAGRASTILIATLSPVLYLVMFLWQPEHFRILWEDPTGRILLATAFVLEIVGVVWVISLVKMD